MTCRNPDPDFSEFSPKGSFSQRPPYLVPLTRSRRGALAPDVVTASEDVVAVVASAARRGVGARLRDHGPRRVPAPSALEIGLGGGGAPASDGARGGARARARRRPRRARATPPPPRPDPRGRRARRSRARATRPPDPDAAPRPRGRRHRPESSRPFPSAAPRRPARDGARQAPRPSPGETSSGWRRARRARGAEPPRKGGDDSRGGTRAGRADARRRRAPDVPRRHERRREAARFECWGHQNRRCDDARKTDEAPLLLASSSFAREASETARVRDRPGLTAAARARVSLHRAAADRVPTGAHRVPTTLGVAACAARRREGVFEHSPRRKRGEESKGKGAPFRFRRAGCERPRRGGAAPPPLRDDPARMAKRTGGGGGGGGGGEVGDSGDSVEGGKDQKNQNPSKRPSKVTAFAPCARCGAACYCLRRVRGGGGTDGHRRVCRGMRRGWGGGR